MPKGKKLKKEIDLIPLQVGEKNITSGCSWKKIMYPTF